MGLSSPISSFFKQLLLVSLVGFSCSVGNAFLKIPHNSFLHGAGNEPGWSLKIYDNRSVVWVTNYGQDTIAIDAKKEDYMYSTYEVDKTKAERLYFPTRDLTLDVRHASCSDDMSGEKYNKTIVIIYKERTYRGCANFRKTNE